MPAFENDFEKCEYKQVDGLCQDFLGAAEKKYAMFDARDISIIYFLSKG